MKLTLDTVKIILKNRLPALRDEFGVSKIGIFGSIARDDATGKSDIDILVEFSQTPGFFKFMALENFLTRVLKRKVDLVTKIALQSAIKNEVLRSTMCMIN